MTLAPAVHIFSPPALLQSVERCSEQNYEKRSQLSKFEDLPYNQITILQFQAPKKFLYLDPYWKELLMSSSTSFGSFDHITYFFEMNRVKFGYISSLLKYNTKLKLNKMIVVLSQVELCLLENLWKFNLFNQCPNFELHCACTLQIRLENS